MIYYFSLSLLAICFICCSVINGQELNSPKVIPVTTPQPENGKIYPLAIIGAGAAGTMAAKRSVLNNQEVLLFAGAQQERRRSRGNWVRKVDNIPGFEKYQRTILELRNETLVEIVNSPLGSNLYLIEDSIVSIKDEKIGNFFKLKDGKGETYYAKYVILATGMMDEQPHIQGSIRPILPYANGQTVAYCLLCDGHRSLGKKTAVIGYSEDAAKGALLLSEKYSLQELTILTNGRPPEFSEATQRKLQERNIQIIIHPIEEITGNLETKQLQGFRFTSGETLEAEIAFVLLGIRPNNSLALQLGAEVDSRGLVITDSNGETTIPNLFVAGDLRANGLKQIYTAWQHAVECTQTINRRVRESE